MAEERVKILLEENDVPKNFYNILPDLPRQLDPPLHPGTKEPATAGMLEAIFPKEIVRQEMSQERHIPIPDKVRDALLRSFSKEFNMENWRLGYAVAPKDVAGELTEFLQATSTCVAPFVQAAGVACLENEKELLEINREIWKMRMASAGKAMKSAGFKFAASQSGMYIFASHGGIADSGKYVMKLLDKGVATAPGSAFGDFEGFVRICANQPEDALEEAIAKMEEAAK